MLLIDAEAGTVQVVWRAVVPVPPAARVIAFEVALSGRFEPPPPPIEAAPETQPFVHAAPAAPAPIAAAPPAAPVRAVRVATSAPAERLRFDDPRSALMERMAAGQPLDDLDLEGADLSKLDLSMRSLGRCKLDGANLHGANLRGANLWGVVAGRRRSDQRSARRRRP
ncbi:MAG: pentapeptide repeat-containing protein [Polyangiaceae bacterium]|nr:pentapeptide repeat-containing protein [Polyangiaceae bacterium]